MKKVFTLATAALLMTGFAFAHNHEGDKKKGKETTKSCCKDGKECKKSEAKDTKATAKDSKTAAKAVKKA